MKHRAIAHLKPLGKQIFATCALTLFLSMALASTALAGDGGQGWYGPANDKVVTFFGLGLVVLFPLIALIGTLIQSRLEKNADERKKKIFK